MEGCMSRRKKTTLNTALHSDLGPLIQRARGDLVVVDATDPERPNAPPIRRAERNPHYAQWWKNGKISRDEYLACDKYGVLHEARDGARWRPDVAVRVSGGGAGCGPTMSMVQASAALTTAHRAIGLDGAALLSLFVVENHPIAEIARRRCEHQHVAAGRVLAAIRRLAEHWTDD
jgi:hypothetical protein